MPSRVILHVDMNAFFASVEQRSNPLLRGKPVVVVGDMSRRSVILTASYEARPFGIKTGMLLHEARAVCPRVIPVEGDYEKYTSASEEIGEALTAFSDRVEMTSCDEAYLDVTAVAGRWGGPAGIARAVQERLAETPGLPCSVGAAPNKLLAKLGSDMKKPRGVTVIAPEDVPALMEKTPVEALCGVGRRLQASLAALGVRTCAELGRMNFETLYRRFGAWGFWLKRMGQGRDDSEVALAGASSAVKSVGHSMTFPRNTWDREVVKSYLMHLCEKVGRRLRRKGFRGRGIAVTVRYADFETVSRHTLFPEPTDDDVEIYRRVMKVLDSFRDFPKAVRLAGVSVSSLAGMEKAGYLWDAMEKPRRVSRALDALNRKYGAGTLCRARVVLARRHGILSTPLPPRGETS
jgi:DNA polymerase IV